MTVDGRRLNTILFRIITELEQVNQQLVVSHAGFETVYHIIKSNEEIKVEVEDFDQIAKINKENVEIREHLNLISNVKSETISRKIFI